MNKNTQHLRVLHEREQANKMRTPAFIKLKHSIESCLNPEQLETLLPLIKIYWNKSEDGNDLYLMYLRKARYYNDSLSKAGHVEVETAADELSIESIQHKQNCGAHSKY